MRRLEAVKTKVSRELIRHMPSKTPHETLLYATGDNPEAFVAMVADLLHCREAGASRDQLPDMVSRLVDTTIFTEPPYPCSPPAPTNLENLEGWDCNGHLGHIRSLLKLANRVTLLAHYHIGGFLSYTTAVTITPHNRHAILAAIANMACREERSHYLDTLDSCGCGVCASAHRLVSQGIYDKTLILTLLSTYAL